ncbi:alpha/beta hydrolase [Bandra megavirus]|uniref:Alpha/beta hydrolase n=1 Tax=Bandra megavirus TaxID=2071566 RepID=A0A2K9V8C0_9VIRU|nr:alpha/beta hydrolase [Bandra megavirus]
MILIKMILIHLINIINIMGAWFARMDNSLNNMIFLPPIFDKEIYQCLNTDRSQILELYTQDNELVPVLQIRPKNNAFPAKYIVLSHGNGSDIYTMYEWCKYLSDELDVGIISYDYVGYGLSQDNIPTEEKCYQSLEVAINYLLQEYNLDAKNICLIGQSLGTGIVIDYASKNNWEYPIMLISPYKSICRVVFDSCCITPIDKFRSSSKLHKIHCPVKIIHGMCDELINIGHGKELYYQLNNKSLDPVWIPETGHNDILDKIDIYCFKEVIYHKNS